MKIYLVHGWGGDNTTPFFKYITKNLPEVEIIAPNMPNTDNPKINEWVGFLEEKVKENGIDNKTYLIGHSIGCQTILRFLEKSNQKIAGCIFIGGWLKLTLNDKEEERISTPWLESPIDFEKVRKNCDSFLAIFSDNDPYVPLENIKLFQEKLNAKTILKKGQEHFIEVKEIPEILEAIEK